MSKKTSPARIFRSSGLVRLSVSLTQAEAEVFFRMLAMSTGEQTDVDFDALLSIEQKFRVARKPNAMELSDDLPAKQDAATSKTGTPVERSTPATG